MGRTSTKADEKLIKTGLSLARAHGLNGFSVRQLCAKSKVNLGMFYYHFKTKDNFDRALMKAIYTEMLADINIKISPAAAPRQNVRAALLSISAFIQKNRVLLSSLAGDVFSGNSQIAQYVQKNFTEHVAILRQQLKRAHKDGLLKTHDDIEAMLTIVPTVVMPQLLLGVIERMPLSLAKRVQGTFIKHRVESGVAKRVDLLLDAVFKE